MTVFTSSTATHPAINSADITYINITPEMQYALENIRDDHEVIGLEYDFEAADRTIGIMHVPKSLGHTWCMRCHTFGRLREHEHNKETTKENNDEYNSNNS